MRKVPAFTFVEMLVVITLISLIAASIMVRLNQASGSARDKKRLVDLRTVQSALTLYNSDWDSYPSSLNFGGSLTNSDGSRTYLHEIPQDPSYPTKHYYYSSDTNSYVLCASLEEEKNIPQSGDSHYPPSSVPAGGCGSNCNYCLEGD